KLYGGSTLAQNPSSFAERSAHLAACGDLAGDLGAQCGGDRRRERRKGVRTRLSANNLPALHLVGLVLPAVPSFQLSDRYNRTPNETLLRVCGHSRYLNVAPTKPWSRCKPHKVRLPRHQAPARACRNSSL